MSDIRKAVDFVKKYKTQIEVIHQINTKKRKAAFMANILSVKNKKRVENIDLVSIFISWIRKTALSTFEKFLNKK